ncbi:MAG: hypothetical protein E6H53_17765 [Betaproteobacteria bacterium]|nr:MAG: hypothetical protein E6H53_17765 [Betaproteobacteria bacterium]
MASLPSATAFNHGLQLLARLEAGLRVGLRLDHKAAGDAARDGPGEERIAFARQRCERIFVGEGDRRVCVTCEQRDENRGQRAGNRRFDPRHTYFFFGPASDIAF